MEQIAMYLRLLKEDEFIKDESNSITNQRAFIRGFINKDKDLRKMNVVEFVDDGYTGKNMDRPDMQRMLDLIKRKQISCVIVKDFSRFFRDHIEQGKYIEQIFPFMGVRLMLLSKGFYMISSVKSSLRRFLSHWMPSVATENILLPLLLTDMQKVRRISTSW